VIRHRIMQVTLTVGCLFLPLNLGLHNWLGALFSCGAIGGSLVYFTSRH
jgi:hypothetical protein